MPKGRRSVTDDIDWTRLVPLDAVRFANDLHRQETEALWAMAIVHLEGMSGPPQVLQKFLALSEAGVVGAFLVQTQVNEATEKWSWIVVGDLPALAFPACFARNQYQALNVYCQRVAQWIEALEQHRANECPDGFEFGPAPADLAHLRRKLDVLDAHILRPASYLL
jgi:hypothetical protein